MDNSTDMGEMSRKEKQRAYYHKWYTENSERARAYHRKWYAENKERLAKARNERYNSDPEYRAKSNLSHKKWAMNRPETVAAAKLRYFVNTLRREGYTVIPPEGVEI